MQFKKVGKIVAAGTLAGLMMGSSVAFAALDAYPSPFVTSSGVQSLIVVGSQGTDPVGLASDVAGAIDIAARLGGEAFTEVPVSGTGVTGTVSGEGSALATANEKIYLGDNLRKTGLKVALSDTDLPTVLKSGTVTDSDGGTTYDYDQFVDFSDDYALNFAKISGDLPDPQYLFGEFTTSPSSTNYVYRTRVVFTDEVNNATVVGEKIEIFGNRYTFSSGTTSTKVELFGGADTRTMSEGEAADVVISGTTYSVQLLVVSDADTVAVKVGSDSKSIDKGKSATVGGLEVFVDDVFFSSKEGTISSASVLLGARRLILDDGTQAKTKVGGESEKTLDGTFVDISQSGGKLTGIDVYVAGLTSKDDYLNVGGTYTDPIWQTVKLNFASISSDLKSATRDYTEITPSGTKDLNVRFTNDRGDTGNIKWAHIADSTDTTPDLADDNGDAIIATENIAVDRNQYFVVDSGDFSRIFELTSASSLGTADGKVDIRDVMSGKTIEVKLGTTNVTSKVIDGQTYFFNASTNVDTTNINLRVLWGDAASGHLIGDFQTVWPTMKTQRGARVALTMPVDINFSGNTNRVNLPTGSVNVSVTVDERADFRAITSEKSEASVLTEGTNVSVGAPNNFGVFTLGRTSTGGQKYNVTTANISDGTVEVTFRLATNTGVPVTDPAFLLREEQDDASNVYSHYIVGDTETRSGNEEMTPALTSGQFTYTNVKSGSPDSDSDLTKFVDLWGTYIEYNVKDQNRVWMWYPDEQVSGNVFFLDSDASVSTSGGASGTVVRSAVPVKTSVARLDREVTSADRSNKHLILVGGPAVNSLVAELGTAGKTWTRDQYVSAGAGTGILNLVENAFTSGKSALVVAGHSAADTRQAASVLQTFDTHKSELTGKMLAVWKNGVISSTSA